MATTPRLQMSSVFDDMLSKSKDSFDQLFRRGAAPRPTTVAPPIDIDPACEPARRLNEQFGRDWGYEIVEQRRDADEVIVLCRLTFGKEAAVRAQFGRAKIGGIPVVGTGDGVRFSLEAGTGAKDEHQALQRATEAALTNCLELI